MLRILQKIFLKKYFNSNKNTIEIKRYVQYVQFFEISLFFNLFIYLRRRKQDEVQVLEETIRMRSEKHKKAGVELNATCHICLKTKFADGVGHICNYCDIRCCARCGGKVTLRSSKVRKKSMQINGQKSPEVRLIESVASICPDVFLLSSYIRR